MVSRAFVRLLIGFFSLISAVPMLAAERNQRYDGVDLLQPLGDRRSIDVSAGIGTFIDYFNDAAEWMLWVAVGICTLWTLIGGIMIMVSGNDGGLRAKGISYMKWSIGGLVILLFAGTILRLLNDLYFT